MDRSKVKNARDKVRNNAAFVRNTAQCTEIGDTATTDEDLPHCVEHPLAGVVVLREFADETLLGDALESVVIAAPPRHMALPRGRRMAVATTSCGDTGWVADTRGYRYSDVDPLSGDPWPPMPACFSELSRKAAEFAGFQAFEADTCLVNRYAPGVGMGAHQDRDERDFSQPIVSVSLGLPARFFVVGAERKGRSTPIDLKSGDVLVFGGTARRYYHGVRPVKPGQHPRFGCCRWNLTFRRAR